MRTVIRTVHDPIVSDGVAVQPANFHPRSSNPLKAEIR